MTLSWASVGSTDALTLMVVLGRASVIGMWLIGGPLLATAAAGGGGAGGGAGAGAAGFGGGSLATTPAGVAEGISRLASSKADWISGLTRLLVRPMVGSISSARLN